MENNIPQHAAINEPLLQQANQLLFGEEDDLHDDALVQNHINQLLHDDPLVEDHINLANNGNNGGVNQHDDAHQVEMIQNQNAFMENNIPQHAAINEPLLQQANQLLFGEEDDLHDDALVQNHINQLLHDDPLVEDHINLANNGNNGGGGNLHVEMIQNANANANNGNNGGGGGAPFEGCGACRYGRKTCNIHCRYWGHFHYGQNDDFGRIARTHSRQNIDRWLNNIAEDQRGLFFQRRQREADMITNDPLGGCALQLQQMELQNNQLNLHVNNLQNHTVAQNQRIVMLEAMIQNAGIQGFNQNAAQQQQHQHAPHNPINPQQGPPQQAPHNPINQQQGPPHPPQNANNAGGGGPPFQGCGACRYGKKN